MFSELQLQYYYFYVNEVVTKVWNIHAHCITMNLNHEDRRHATMKSQSTVITKSGLYFVESLFLLVKELKFAAS